MCDVHHLQEIVDLLEDKGQVILYGPPGTGKTYLAQVLAEALAPEEQARSLVQFHPAYSYEDFFEGYRPVTDDDKQMTYELTPGPLAKLAEHASDNLEQQHVMVIDEINRANLPKGARRTAIPARIPGQVDPSNAPVRRQLQVAEKPVVHRHDEHRGPIDRAH